jgi:COMPASS component SWD2
MSHLHTTSDYVTTGNNNNHSTSSAQHPTLHAQPPAPVVLTPALLSALKVAKIFKDNTQIITSLDFDDTGTKCVTSAQDESLHVYDCVTGKYARSTPHQFFLLSCCLLWLWTQTIRVDRSQRTTIHGNEYSSADR